jgi:hypothetical protein
VNFYPAPRWTADDFAQAQIAATEAFRQERLIEPADLYNEAFLACRQAIIDLFRLSANLMRPLEVAVEITAQPMLLEVLRYLTGPPVSEDDLKVLTGASLAPARLRNSPDMARRVIETMWGAVDPHRFPWVHEAVEPTTEEAEAATLATATLMATRRVMTARANQAKTHQEELVTTRLRTEGFEEVRTRVDRLLGARIGQLGRFLGSRPVAPSGSPNSADWHVTEPRLPVLCCLLSGRSTRIPEEHQHGETTEQRRRAAE